MRRLLHQIQRLIRIALGIEARLTRLETQLATTVRMVDAQLQALGVAPPAVTAEGRASSMPPAVSSPDDDPRQIVEQTWTPHMGRW